VPFWRAVPESDDTRLSPDEPDVRRFVVGDDVTRLRVRVIHRRFWDSTTKAKRWPQSDLVVIDRLVEISGR
jgi:excinuclease UvrABC nuclease subunit